MNDRMAFSKIRIKFPDGTTIMSDNVTQTLVDAIEKIGVDRVAALRLPGIAKHGIPLLSRNKTTIEPYPHSYRELSGGYFLLTYSNTQGKFRILEKISDELDLHLEISEIKDTTGKIQITPSTKGKNSSKMTIDAGYIEQEDGIWKFYPSDNSTDYVRIPFTDHGTCDTLLVRNHDKLGIFTLPVLQISDYNNPHLAWISNSEEPFPFDEVAVIGMDLMAFGIIACRVGGKVTVYKPFYHRGKGKVVFEILAECTYYDVEEAKRAMIAKRL